MGATRMVPIRIQRYILSTGSLEYIGYRDREHQTLYLSSPIEPHAFYHSQLQVGLYVAALKDTISHDHHSRRMIQRIHPNTRHSRPAPRSQYLRPVWDVRLTLPSSLPMPAQTKMDPTADTDDLSLSLTSEHEGCRTGKVHDAILRVRTRDRDLAFGAVAKLAFGETQKDELESEYRVYAHMVRPTRPYRSRPVSVSLWGGTRPLALVMTHEDTSVEDRGTRVQEGEREEFVRALGAIHRAGVLHGDIRARNLVASEVGCMLSTLGGRA